MSKASNCPSCLTVKHIPWQALRLALGLLLAIPLRSAAAGDSSRPHLETRHGVRQLVVDGEPRNSSSSSREYMKPIWPRLVEKRLNTVLAPVSWEMIEPEEGKLMMVLHSPNGPGAQPRVFEMEDTGDTVRIVKPFTSGTL